MTLAIGWLHDGGETVGTWLHQPGDWHRHLVAELAESRRLLRELGRDLAADAETLTQAAEQLADQPISSDATSTELAKHAYRWQAAALIAASAVCNLHIRVGQLRALGWVRQCAEIAEDESNNP